MDALTLLPVIEDLEECRGRGTAREAVLWQHLGKAYFVGGNLPEAVEAFSEALQLRVCAGEDPDLVASSRLAHQRAEPLLSDARHSRLSWRGSPMSR